MVLIINNLYIIMSNTSVYMSMSNFPKTVISIRAHRKKYNAPEKKIFKNYVTKIMRKKLHKSPFYAIATNH